MSIFKTGKVKAIHSSTLEAICEVLDCQPGDILEYRHEGEEAGSVLRKASLRKEL